MHTYKIILILSIVLMLVFQLGCTKKETPASLDELAKESITVNGITREYYIFVPKSYSDTNIPLILNFHGGGANAKGHSCVTNMNAAAEKFGFIVIYPEGTGEIKAPTLRSWNAGTCCGAAKEENIDDIAFTKAILLDIQDKYNINSQKIYATGYSNGAFMAQRLGCEMSTTFSGISSIAGATGVTCAPERKIPILLFHGTSDTSIPYTGGELLGSVLNPNRKTIVDSAETTFENWGKLNNCSSEKEISYQNGEVTCETYTHCNQNAPVTLCTITNGGHTWPGGEDCSGNNVVLRNLLGHITSDINANDFMWNYFQTNEIK